MWSRQGLQAALGCLFAGIGAKYGEPSETGVDVESCTSSAVHQCHGQPSRAACRSCMAEQEHHTAAASHSSGQSTALEAGSRPSNDLLTVAAGGQLTGEATSCEGSASEEHCAPIGAAPERSRAMGTEGMPSAAGSEQPAGHQNGGADWDEAMRECRGRLNRMLTDCGVASLPHQVE